MLTVINNTTTCDMQKEMIRKFIRIHRYLGLQLDSWCCLSVRALLGLGELLGSWGRGAKREAPPVDRCAPIHPCALAPVCAFFVALCLGKDYEYPVMEIIC